MEAEYVEMGLRQLKVRSGVALQTQCQLPDSPKEEAHFLAAIDGKGVMVSHEGPIQLSIGTDYHVRGFTGQYDFHFTVPVLQVFDSPFAYAMLAYPKVVQARKVRQAARMKVCLAASVQAPGQDSAIPVTILDLSVYGAMFQAPKALGVTGDAIRIDVEFTFEDKPAHLSLASTIRHRHQADTEGFYVGVAFNETTTNDKLLLHYLAYTSTQQDAA